ncbi:histidinol-phosphatase HisJ [Gorillibacterium massiliense]|uniref:histidinol-phosphatase HisJ n=1 Tax=Gorillibacterium massiliense TaxID=1280390 RepID=UPI0004B90A4B|nr:histidinol-phosphatase HisJ [Gorillibacterium massiliense]
MEANFKWDGHTHSSFCRHGSSAAMEEYVEQALRLGFERYTISEHPPLPAGWVDNEPLMRELAMEDHELAEYFLAVEQAKAKYAGKLEVTVGLEMDYLHGRTDYSDEIVRRFGSRIEDAVVSVHFLPGFGGMRCLDFTPADFRDGLLSVYGAMEKVVDAYYDHVELAIRWAAGLSMRKRLGHVNLIEKFRDALPPLDEAQMNDRLHRLIPLLKECGVGIDVNTAGMRVATCGKPYVPKWFLARCQEEGIPCVFGSDSHKPEDVGKGWNWFIERVDEV